MDKEKYEDFLGLQNDYCNCPELRTLFSLRKICGSLLEELEIEEAKKDIMKYYAKLTVLGHEGKIEAILHKAPDYLSKLKIDIAKINDSSNSENVITLHCSRCGQQIDIMA